MTEQRRTAVLFDMDYVFGPAVKVAEFNTAVSTSDSDSLSIHQDVLRMRPRNPEQILRFSQRAVVRKRKSGLGNRYVEGVYALDVISIDAVPVAIVQYVFLSAQIDFSVHAAIHTPRCRLSTVLVP